MNDPYYSKKKQLHNLCERKESWHNKKQVHTFSQKCFFNSYYLTLQPNLILC